MEVSPKHSIMTEWKKKATADRSDNTVKDLIWRLVGTCWLTSGFNLYVVPYTKGPSPRCWPGPLAGPETDSE